jgi:iron complex outermembrane recepter protein
MKCIGLRVPSALSFAMWALITNGAARAATEAGAAADNGALEEVVVTATRREENLSRVPISIEAFSQTDLNQRDLKSVGDIASVTPGVDFRGVGYENWITIRGISQNAGGGVAGLGPNTTAIYLDDAPLQARYGNAAVPTAVPTVFDVDHVEVLRGPQGTLFGASAEGGAIRVISRQPSLTEYSGFARAEGSQTDGGGLNSEMGVAYGGPIVQDVLGFRASLWTRHDGGFVDNKSSIFGGLDQSNTNKADSYSGRVALLWQPMSALSLEAAFYYQKRSQNSADLFNATAGNPDEGQFVSTRGLVQPIDDSFYTPSLKVVFDMGWAELTSLTNNLHRSDAQGYDYTSVLPPAFGFPVPTTMDYAEPTVVGTTQNNFTQEVRLQSPKDAGRLRWTLGLYYSNLHQHDFETVAAPNLGAEVFENTGQTLEQYFGENLINGYYSYVSDQYFGDKEKAVFGNAEFDLTSQFSLVAGVRYEKQDSTYLTVSDGPVAGGPAVQASVASSHVIAPKAGLNWKVSDETLVYVSAAKGYRPGGVNIPVHLSTPDCIAQLDALGNPDSYKPDSLWSYEIGIKSTMFDHRLSIDASAYHIKWSDIISAIHVPACATHVASNLGDASSNGFDLSLKAVIATNWTTGLYVGYTDAKYSSDTTIFGETLSRSGQAISDISPWNVTAEVGYQAPLTDTMAWYGHLEDRYNSRNDKLVPAQDPTTSSYDPFVTTNPAVNRLDTRFGLRFNSGADVAIFATNLLNAHPLLNRYDGLIDITSGAFTILPRTYGVSLLYHW